MNEFDRNSGENTQENGERLIDDSLDKLVITNPSNQESEANYAAIFKLNIDCFEVLFERLRLWDLQQLRRTCKRMNKIVDYYILQIYPYGFGRLTIYSLDIIPICLKGRLPYHNRHRIISFDDLRRCDSKISKLFKHFYFKVSSIDHDWYQNIEHILRDAEVISLELSGCCTSFLPFCKSLKCLCINGVGTFENLIKNDEDWFHQSHPMLKQLVLMYQDATPTGLTLLQQLFDHNPGIQKLTISSDFLQDNQEWIKSSNIHLDQLVIVQKEYRNGVLQHIPNDLLNELHDKQSFYQRLHLYSLCTLTTYPSDEITNIRALEKLNISSILKHEVNLPQIKHLKEFGIVRLDDFLGGMPISDAIADNFANIESFRFVSGLFSYMLPFIRRCAKLKEIRCVNALGGPYINEKSVIDLVGLNIERRKCVGGRKVILYVPYVLYYQTKRLTNQTDFGLIEIRINSKWCSDHSLFNGAFR